MMMQAMVMTTPGEPEVLQLQQRPVPIIRHDRQVRIRLMAAGVNPIDTKVRQRGTFYPDQMPAILGCDGAGVVEDVGNQVTLVQPGDAVYFCQGGLGAEPGNYAEYIVVDERFVAPKPKSLSFQEAAAAPLVLITAWEALFDRGRLQPDQRVLIHAGAGGVGHVAIQLAKIAGVKVATTVSTPDKVEFVTRLGADLPIRYQEADFVQTILDWTYGDGVDLAFDTVGGDLITQTFPAVKLYGDMVSILEPPPSTVWKVARNRNLRFSMELMLTPMLQGLVSEQERQAGILKQCGAWMDAGKLKVHVDQVFQLQDAAIAHRQIERGHTMGKLVLNIAKPE